MVINLTPEAYTNTNRVGRWKLLPSRAASPEILSKEKKWERTVVVAKISYELNGRWWCFCSTEWAKIKTLLGKVGERTLAMLMFVRFLCVHAGNFLMLKAKQSWKRGIGQSRVNCVEFASEVCNARWNLFRMFNLFCKVKTKLFDFKFYSTSNN